MAKPKYTDPDEMRRRCDEYFEGCSGHVAVDKDGIAILDARGNPVIVGAHPMTMTGLARALGFESRRALARYAKREKFAGVVREARMRIEEYTEERLFDRDGQRGAQFSLLHNFRWGEDDDGEAGGTSGGVVMMPPILPTDEAAASSRTTEEEE